MLSVCRVTLRTLSLLPVGEIEDLHWTTKTVKVGRMERLHSIERENEKDMERLNNIERKKDRKIPSLLWIHNQSHNLSQRKRWRR